MIDGLELQGARTWSRSESAPKASRSRSRSGKGSTENTTVATTLVADLVERGLDPEQGILFVIDGAKALRKTIRNVLGEAPVQRCVRHKERNVLDHLPERERPSVKQRVGA